MPINVLALLPEIILTVFGVIVMMAEPVIAPGRSRRPLGWFAILGTILSGVAAWLQHRRVDYHGGHAVNAFYSTIQMDNFSVFFHLLIASILLVTLLASIDYFEASSLPASADFGTSIRATHAGEFYALCLFGAVGMMIMSSSVELLMAFIGLEISSISTYILAGYRKGQATASESALKYFLLGSFATAFFLYGIALAFGATGSTQIAAISAGLATTHTPRLAFLAVAMVLIGLGFKVSAAPFHVWTPDVYQGAPAPVVGFMSTAPKAGAFAVLLRFLFSGTPSLRAEWLPLIYILAVLSMCIGNLGALLQRDVKRMLAYSSIAHAGYLLVAFSSTYADAVGGACFYTAAYAAMNVGAFVVVTQLSGYNEDMRSIDDFTGVALRRPGLAGLLAFFLFSMIGIPFTGGFFGKFYAFSAAVHGGHVWLAIVGLINSGVACYYYLRLLAALYSRPVIEPAATTASSRRITAPAAVALAATAAATLLLGIEPNHVLNLLQRSTPETLPVVTQLQPASVPPAAVSQTQP